MLQTRPQTQNVSASRSIKNQTQNVSVNRSVKNQTQNVSANRSGINFFKNPPTADETFSIDKIINKVLASFFLNYVIINY